MFFINMQAHYDADGDPAAVHELRV